MPFKLNSSKIQFKIGDKADNIQFSDVYAIPYTVYLPLLTKSDYHPPYEPNNSCETPYGPLVSDQVYLAYPDDLDDFYCFEVDTAKVVRITVNDYQATGQVLLYKACPSTPDNIIYHAEIIDNPTTFARTIGPGPIILRIYTSDNQNTDHLYELKVTY